MQQQTQWRPQPEPRLGAGLNIRDVQSWSWCFSLLNRQGEAALDEMILGVPLMLFNFIFMMVVIHIGDKLRFKFKSGTP